MSSISNYNIVLKLFVKNIGNPPFFLPSPILSQKS